jgi:hypothetical protein
MLKHLRRVALLAAVLAVPAGVALAQGGPPYGWGWRFGPPAHGYFSDVEEGTVDYGKVDAAAWQVLSKAAKGEIWTTPGGAKLTPLLVNGQIVGQLWEDLDPKTLTTGSFWAGPWGVNVQLVKDGKVVGMIWVKMS